MYFSCFLIISCNLITFHFYWVSNESCPVYRRFYFNSLKTVIAILFCTFLHFFVPVWVCVCVCMCVSVIVFAKRNKQTYLWIYIIVFLFFSFFKWYAQKITVFSTSGSHGNISFSVIYAHFNFKWKWSFFLISAEHTLVTNHIIFILFILFYEWIDRPTGFFRIERKNAFEMHFRVQIFNVQNAICVNWMHFNHFNVFLSLKYIFKICQQSCCKRKS